MPNLAAGGGNPSGFNASGGVAPIPNNGQLGKVGGNNNPLIAPMPSQQQWPGLTSPYSFSANGQYTDPNANPLTSALPNPGQNNKEIVKELHKTGMPSGIATLLSNFLSSGAGYNPQVLNALIAQLQPQINRGQANIMEQFGSQGLGMSSPAAIGMGDYMSQVNLNEEQIAAQLYEQSVQNYMQVLMGMSHEKEQPSFWQGVGEQLIGSAIKAGMSGLGGGFSSMAGGGSFGGGFMSGMGSSLSSGG